MVPREFEAVAFVGIVAHRESVVDAGENKLPSGVRAGGRLNSDAVGIMRPVDQRLAGEQSCPVALGRLGIGGDGAFREEVASFRFQCADHSFGQGELRKLLRQLVVRQRGVGQVMRLRGEFDAADRFAFGEPHVEHAGFVEQRCAGILLDLAPKSVCLLE